MFASLLFFHVSLWHSPTFEEKIIRNRTEHDRFLLAESSASSSMLSLLPQPLWIFLLTYLLSLLSFVAAWGVDRGLLDGLQSWQTDRFFQLLLASGMWFFATATLLLIVTHVAPLSVPQRAIKIAVVVLCTTAVFLIFTQGWLSFTRHLRFNSTGYDLAIHEQIVWNTLNGRFFASSVEVDNSFADHFRPFLLFLVPIYALLPSPLTLLGLQTAALALGAVPLYLLAHDKLQERILPVVLVVVYLAYPTLAFANRFDIHTEMFAVPAFIAAFYMLEKERWGWASFWLLIPLLCKETLGLTVAAFGLYALLFKRNGRFGLLWLLVGLSTFWLTSFWLIPFVRGESADALLRYQWLGDSPMQMALTVLGDPLLVWQHLTAPARLLYLLQLLLPVGFVALLGWPALLLAAPALLLNLLAQHHCQPTIYCQYSIPIAPFVLIAAVLGLQRLGQLTSPRFRNLVGLGLLLTTMIAVRVDNPVMEAEALPSALETIGNAEVVQMALAAVSPDGSLVTSNDYAPHLAQREELYIIGIPSQREAPRDPDLLFINLYDQQFIVCDQYRDYVSQLEVERYGTLFRTGGLLVAQRDGGDPTQFADFVHNWNNCAG